MCLASPAQVFHNSSLPRLRGPVRPFADVHYLLRMIDYLKRARLEQGLSLVALARRARIKLRLIRLAEQDGFVVNSRDFKAWCSALGLSWNQVWSDCFPRVSGPSIQHLT